MTSLLIGMVQSKADAEAIARVEARMRPDATITVQFARARDGGDWWIVRAALAAEG